MAQALTLSGCFLESLIKSLAILYKFCERVPSRGTFHQEKNGFIHFRDKTCQKFVEKSLLFFSHECYLTMHFRGHSGRLKECKK
jgi:hypothetical protein